MITIVAIFFVFSIIYQICEINRLKKEFTRTKADISKIKATIGLLLVMNKKQRDQEIQKMGGFDA